MKPRTIPTDPDALLTEVEVAQLFGASVRTLQAWRTRRGGPPFVRLGRMIRYRRGSLDEWTKANTHLTKAT